MKILFIEPRCYFERLIDIKVIEKNHEVTFGVPMFLVSLRGFLLRYDYIATCIEHSVLSRNIISNAVVLNIRTGLISDGTYEFTNATKNPYLKSIKYNLLENVSFSDIYSPDNMMKSYIRSFGTKFHYYLPLHAKYYNGEGMKEVIVTKRVLITTANSAYFNEEEFIALCSIIKSITQSLTNQNFEFRFRIFDKRLIKELKITPDINELDSDISSCISLFSHVITTPSTIVYTSIEAKKPTALLLYRDSPITQPAGWLIFNNVNLNKTLYNFIENGNERLAFQTRSIFSGEHSFEPQRSEAKHISYKSDFLNFNFETLSRKLNFVKKLVTIVKKWLGKSNGL
ncbi:hypothetical protein [Pseudoalteromonas sp. C12FD-1]|uniref:hypothetical protein n=1 Tax=Pseudoalteromonas sp. C12FD-1 TaxID=3131979 RepID=UPI00307E5D8F